ncbi:MAG: transposase [Thermoplasmata archaeon]|nr:transposase [Candidatus Sysuiplasma jiujiangense]
MRRDSANSIRKRCGSRCHERKRDWRKYNEWQCKEIVLACTVLRGLVDNSRVHYWERRDGRPRIARRDIVLCLLVKACLNVSCRRLTGFLSRIPHFSTLAAYNRMPSMEVTLKSLLGHTAEGAWKEESIIAIDSSGLLLHGSGSWRSSRYREGRKDYGKIHVLSGTDSLMTLAVRTTRGTWDDSTRPGQLMNEVTEGSTVTAVATDIAYWNLYSVCADKATWCAANGTGAYRCKFVFSVSDRMRGNPHGATIIKVSIYSLSNGRRCHKFQRLFLEITTGTVGLSGERRDAGYRNIEKTASVPA